MTEPTTRRAHERAPLEIEVSLESEHNFYSGLTEDISEGGVFIATYVPPKVGADVSLTLKLPGEDLSFEVHGVVRWVRDLRVQCEGVQPGFGMQWTQLPVEALHAIQRFVRRRDTLFFDAA